MDYSVIVQLVGLVAVLAIVWWLVQRFALPEPLRIVVYVVFGLLAIMLVGNITGLWGAPLWRAR
jgi:predicted membrane channel-forming protein YqfA (hemolysin III family)